MRFDFGNFDNSASGVGRCHSVPDDDEESDIFERSRPAEPESARDDSYIDDLFGNGRHKKKKAK